MARLPHPYRYLLGIVLAVFYGCSDSKIDEEPPPDTPYLTVTEEPAATIGSRGGSTELTFTTNTSWQVVLEPLEEEILPPSRLTSAPDTAASGTIPSASSSRTSAAVPCSNPASRASMDDTSDEPWYKVTPLSGTEGKDLSVTLTFNPNETYSPRGIAVVLQSQSALPAERFTIVQQKKNAILVGDNRREVDASGQTLEVEVQANVEYSVTIREGAEWIEQVPESRATPGLEAHTHRFGIAANTDAQVRTGVIVFTDEESGLADELTVVQAAWDDPDPERTGLTALYEATGGGGWLRSDNWCSDKPLSQWYGVETDEQGHVTALRLARNNLAGMVPEQIGLLVHLRHLDLSWNELEGDLNLMKDWIWYSFYDNLLKLETVDLSHNKLTGGVPGSWSKMMQLHYLDLSSNRLSDTAIPIQWEYKFRDGKYMDVHFNDNYFGHVNDFVINHPEWNRLALRMIRQKYLVNGNIGTGDLKCENVYLPEIILHDLRDGSQRSLRELYSANKLTMLLSWNPLQQESVDFMQTAVKRLHTLYGPQGFAVVAITPEGEQYRQAAEQYLAAHEVPWPVVTDYTDAQGKRIIIPTYPYPSALFVDQSGKVVEDLFTEKRIYDPEWYSGKPQTTLDMVGEPFKVTDMMNALMEQTFGNSEYQSTDFSMDKQYVTLQTATRGKGIDIVLIGDAFTDIDIETGFYRQLMEYAMESFFALEPMKSYREYFNVHMVYAVSQDAWIGDYLQPSNTALGVMREANREWFNIYKPRQRLPDYYHKAVPYGITPSTVGVIINNTNGGVADLRSIALGPNYAFIGYYYGYRHNLKGSLLHEAVGHAFGLCGDEYETDGTNPMTGMITESRKRELKNAHSMGWYLNLSLEKDAKSVYWAHLIGHPKYTYTGLYEGGYYANLGVWRSEDASIMRDHRSTFYFNAICREMIVKRIMQLAGEEYSFEKFMAKDSDNGRPGTIPATSVRRYARLEHSHQPPILEF